MTMKTSQVERTPSISKEDAALYRLFAVLGFAIVCFAGLILIGKNEGLCWGVLASLWFKIPMYLLFAASVVLAVLHKAGKLVIANNVFSLGGACAFLAPVFLMFAVYTHMTSANVKAKIALIAIVFIAFIFNVAPKNYGIFTTVSAICALCIYYIATPKGYLNSKVFELMLKVLSYPVGIVLPVLAAVVLLLAKKNNGVFKLGKLKLLKINDLSTIIPMVVMMCVALVCAIAMIFVPSLLVPFIIAYGVVFVAVGIICTTKIF